MWFHEEYFIFIFYIYFSGSRKIHLRIKFKESAFKKINFRWNTRPFEFLLIISISGIYLFYKVKNKSLFYVLLNLILSHIITLVNGGFVIFMRHKKLLMTIKYLKINRLPITLLRYCCNKSWSVTKYPTV